MTWFVAGLVGAIVGLLVSAQRGRYQAYSALLGALIGIVGGILGFWLMTFILGAALTVGGSMFIDAVVWGLIGSLVLTLIVQAFMPAYGYGEGEDIYVERVRDREPGIAHEYRERGYREKSADDDGEEVKTVRRRRR